MVERAPYTRQVPRSSRGGRTSMKEDLNRGKENKPNIKSRLRKIAGAGILGATLITPLKAKGQEPPTSPDTTASETYEDEHQVAERESLQEASPDLDKEEYWLEMYTPEALKRFAEWGHKDFAEHLLEKHLEKTQNDPVLFLDNIQALKSYVGYKEILERSARSVLASDFYYTYLLQEALVDIYKDLDDYKNILEEAAQKSVTEKGKYGKDGSDQVLRNAEVLFKHLSKTSAEYYLQRAVNNMLDDKYFVGFDLLWEAETIKKYLPNAENILWTAAQRGIEIDAVRFFIEFFRRPNNAFSEEKTLALIDKIVEEDPDYALSFIIKEVQGEVDLSIYSKLMLKGNSSILDHLRSIAQSEMTENEKERTAALIDAMIFDKHLTLEEMKAIVNDPPRAAKLAAEIRSRKNFIGRQSLNRHFPIPKQNTTTQKP